MSDERRQEPRADGPILCGIGASAGGLEPLKTLLSEMPDNTGVAFAVIMHLQADADSELPAILDRTSRMPARKIESGMSIEANSVYVIPPGVGVRLDDASFALTEQSSGYPKTPINDFFRSLAAGFGPRAIGVVLSGMGTDGAVGIREIKASLGLTIVQDPSTAEFPTMPNAAIDSGMIDLVESPEDIARRVALHAEGLPTSDDEALHSRIDSNALQSVFSILQSRLGYDFSHYKESTMRRRVGRRLALHQIDSFSEYVTYLEKEPQETRELFRELLIGVTSFFRDAASFKALQANASAGPFDWQERKELRIWVPACSTGEEAYSIAIIIHEILAEKGIAPSVYIFATDIDETAIRRARTGTYPDSISGDVSAERLKEYFEREGNTYRIRNNIRSMVVFSTQNVLEDPPFTRLDLVSCRNLLIYLNRDIQRKVIQLFHYALRPGGILMLGSSESVGNATDLFSPLDATHRLFVRRPEQYARHKRLELPLSGSLVDTSPRQTRSTSEKPLQRRIEQYLLDAHTPEAVFVDEERTIVYFHGRTGQLFEPARGVPRTNISDMAREGLRGELSTALTETSGANEVTVRTNVRVRADGGEISVDFEVIPLSADVGLQDMYAVVFTRIAPIAEAREEQPKPAVSPSEDGEPSRVEALEAELVATKERLQSTVEQLETSNEELKSSLEEYQSTNEELQSSNEELESSKEEMQSLNEELSTVNQELQDKNQEISRAYEEMKNYLDNVEIPIVFVDTGMRVKRFNESATEIINLIASDVNRPLSQITTNVHYEELVDDVDEAIRKARYHEVVIEHNNGERYWVRIAPYKNIDNVVEGALVTFVPFPPSNLKNGR